MNTLFTRLTKILCVAVLLTTLGACAVPRPGPNKGEIFGVERDGTSATKIVVVDESVNRMVAVAPRTSFPNSLLSTASAVDRIRPGDTLSLIIYENVDDSVFRDGSSNLNSIQVDDAGFIFIPYAGRIRAAGNTPNRVRQIITEKLATLTPEPQVLIQRATGDGATVSVLGDGIASQGVYPIQRSSRRLMELLATAGGITAPAEVVRITLLRNHTKGELWFEDIYDHPKYNVALRAGDQVHVQRDPRSFTVLGALGRQTNELFTMRQPSALQAVAQVGGLDSQAADPTGIFVIRNQEAEFANNLLGRNDLIGEQSIIYVLDLTKPNGIALARGFDIRDGDTIYVTEAPSVQWAKTFRVLRGAVGAARSVEGLAN